ncbi:hypothetical protein NHF45_07850 [Maricaulaceae bacterium NA33B04]|nr:hypothetical protein [Maricaulaceae bacterium NA33B04]
MPHAFKARENELRTQNRGRASQAWRWFSLGTVKASRHFRDWSWRKIGLHVLGAVSLLAGSRIDPTWALSPWMLIGGLGWTLWSLRAAALKLLDRQST